MASYPNHLQDIKDCKTVTPDKKFKKGQVIEVESTKSLLTDKYFSGIYLFDTYDSFDGTVFITREPHYHATCFNIPYSKIKLHDFLAKDASEVEIPKEIWVQYVKQKVTALADAANQLKQEQRKKEKELQKSKP